MRFQGTPAEYRALHYWVSKQLGKPRECWECGTTDATYYDWSNVSGLYLKDLSDWRRLCRRCHLIADGPRLRGKQKTEPVTYNGTPLEGTTITDIDLSKAIRTMSVRSKLYKMLKAELSARGWWKNRRRGRPTINR